MVKGEFSWRWCAALAIMNGKIDSQPYTNVLHEKFLPFVQEKHQYGFIFNQNGASVHRSNATLQYLADCDVDVLDWLSRSPGLDPIENLWGLLVRLVYHNQCQFDSVCDLEESIIYE